MSKYDVVIIGGGVSGLSCAITLGSGALKHEFAQKKILIIDSGKSQLKAAKLNNAAGVKVGSIGPEVLLELKERALGYKDIEFKEGNVVKVEKNTGYRIHTAEDVFESEVVVFATGMGPVEIEGLGAKVVPHTRSAKPNTFMIEHQNGLIESGKYVTGTASGVVSMFTTAAGMGAQTASDILSVWGNTYTVIHDLNIPQ